MSIVNLTEVRSYRVPVAYTKSGSAGAAAHEREKKKIYLGACLEQRRNFSSPFVVSNDGLLGKEAKKILLKKISFRRLVEK